MEATGWQRMTTAEREWAVVREAGLAHYRHVDRSELGRAYRDRLEKVKPLEFPSEVWFRAATGDVLHALSSRRGINLAAMLERIPNLTLWPALHVQLIGADAMRVAREREIVRRWANSTKHTVTIDALPPFTWREPPRPRDAQPVASTRSMACRTPGPPSSSPSHVFTHVGGRVLLFPRPFSRPVP